MDTPVLVVRTILSLAVVLGLIWYAGRRLDDSTSGRGGDGMLAGWVRKAGGVVGRAPARGRRRAARPAPVVAVVGRQAIGPKASVAVVDVGGQRLVLGVSEAGVSLLTTLEVPAAAEEITQIAAATQPARVDLTKPVGAALAGQPGLATAAPEAPDAPSAPGTEPAPALVVPDFDEVFAAATAAPRGMNGSILSPTTWRQARAALRPGPTP